MLAARVGDVARRDAALLCDDRGIGRRNRAEFDAGHDRMREGFADRREGGHGFGHRGGFHRMGGFGGPGGKPGAFGHGAFADGDKTISQAEFTAAALERFDRADANHDGTVTAAERRDAMKAFRDQHRADRAADHS